VGGDGAADFMGGFDPLLNDHFHVREGFPVCFVAGGAAGNFRRLGNEGLVLPAASPALSARDTTIPVEPQRGDLTRLRPTSPPALT